MSPIPVTEITEAARLAILTGLASQFKVATNGEFLNLQPLLQIAERLGFRQEPIAPPPRPIPPPPKPTLLPKRNRLARMQVKSSSRWMGRMSAFIWTC